jgi:hypothetical protein
VGLDTYAARTQRGSLTRADLEAFEEAEIELCGGIHSGGWDSFRGKVYDPVVEHVTGVSLYADWIPPETVRRMARAFERCDPERVARETEQLVYQASPAEIVGLRKFFEICAERGLGLVGWW